MIYIDQYHNRYFVRKLSINKNKNIYTNNEIRETERVGTINFRYNLFWFINVSVFVFVFLQIGSLIQGIKESSKFDCVTSHIHVL